MNTGSNWKFIFVLDSPIAKEDLKRLQYHATTKLSRRTRGTTTLQQKRSAIKDVQIIQTQRVTQK